MSFTGAPWKIAYTIDPTSGEAMRKRSSGLILAGTLAVGTVGAVAITPASATLSGNPVTSRLASIKSALSGLVSDGTLTQSQADKVAGTLESKLPKHGLGDHRGRFGESGMTHTRDAAAKALGLTPDKLVAALRSGKTLAAIAKEQNVPVATLVKAIVTATETELATAVKAGQLTQTQADRIKSSLTQRITERVNGVRLDHFRGGNGGAGHGPGDFRRVSPPANPSGSTANTSSATI
jgi:hypothetical protein